MLDANGERWVSGSGSRRCPKADAFIKDVLEICEKHGLSIEHEDSGGAFVISRGSDNSWFAGAMVEEGVEDAPPNEDALINF